MSADLQAPMFTDEDAARAALEAVRWPNGPVCPHCGNVDQDKIAKVEGVKRSHRPGLYYCNACKGQFTATVGTVFERSKVPLSKWWLAVHLLTASKKGMSSHQLHRMLGVTYKTAWFMTHRIREAMKSDFGVLGPLGGSGKTVEADETYFGRSENPRPSKARKGRPPLKRKRDWDKRPVIALVERGGSVRTFHVETANEQNVMTIVADNIDRETFLYTDESRLYGDAAELFAAHGTVKHSAGEYARREGERTVHTNTVEGYFSIFKRGMKGVYQHCGEAHLHRYLAEFDFRYNRRTALGFTDAMRADDAMKGIEGKRLTYRRTGEAPHL
jgi:transposase-like protein